MKLSTLIGVLVSLCIVCLLGAIAFIHYFVHDNVPQAQTSQISSATIVASGDMLYHDIVYGSAYTGDHYDFDNDYEGIKPLISGADLALGDFEGTITPHQPLAGYPLFNAPPEVVQSIKDTGYDVIDLAHNHILDFGLAGALSTYQIFQDNGLDTIGVVKDQDKVLIKEVNGIKVAILGYSYGYNGLEVNLTDEEYQHHMKDLTMSKIKQDLEYAEKHADITVVMPQDGEEYHLQPTDEQRQIYHQMIDWGADIIFGGHPHVVEPIELVNHDDQQKFIIYSMGNLLSNQRIETLDNPYTECGVIVELKIAKQNGETTLQQIVPHPTWVSRVAISRKFEQYQAYDYQVLLSENYLDGGSRVDTVDSDTRQRIVESYDRVMSVLIPNN